MKVTEKFIYEDYVLQYPKSKLSFEQWFTVIKKLIWEIASEITYNNGIWVPPHKIGFLSIIKFNSQKRQIGLIANKTELKPVAVKLMRMKFNFDTFGYMFKTKWDRRSNYCRLRHRDYYKFKWEKPIKSMISNHILSSHTDRDKKMADAPLNVV